MASRLPRPGRTAILNSAGAIVALLLTVFAALSGPAQADVVSGSLFSPSNNETFSYRVFTPPGYNPNDAARYPVVFSLHGNGGTPAQRATNYSPTLTSKMNSGEIMPMIWVFPDGQRDSYYGDAYDGSKQVYSHIIDELLPVIDANYKTIADRDHRALEGFSMGGFGSGLYGAKRTDLFSATLLQGAVLPTWTDLVRKEPDVALNMYNNQESNWLPYSVYDVSAANATSIIETVNYKMVVGDADGHRAGNVAFRDYLISLGIDPQFEWLPGVTHSGGLYLQEGTGLRFLNDHFTNVGEPPPPPPPPPPPTWTQGLKGEYFNDVALASPASTRVDATVNFRSDWGSAPAGTAVTPDDVFSVRWTGEVDISAAGDWTFATTSNDGVRLWIGDQLLIDNWTTHAITQNTATLSLAAGWQPLRLEYFQNKGLSEITLSYAAAGQALSIIPTERLRVPGEEPPPPPPPPPPPTEWTPGLKGDYFNDTALTALASTRVDATVNFTSDWGSAPAGTAVTADDIFSVRWTGEVEVAAAGDWTFTTTSNDGVRLWIGDQLLIDNWTTHAITQNSATLSLAAGWHPLRLEYFQNKGVSEITLSYAEAGQGLSIIPTERLRTPVSGVAGFAVPEPGTCVLLLLGALGFVGQQGRSRDWRLSEK